MQIGIRTQSGYFQVNGNFGSTNNGNDIAKTLDLNGSGQVDIGQINFGVGGGDGADTLIGHASTSNLIFAYGGNDIIYADNNQVSQFGSVIDGGPGNDTIYASNGDDQYLFERGDGQDTIFDTGGQNSVIFGPTVAASDVIYQIVGDDLYIGIRDLNNPNLAASQVADNLRFVGGGDQYVNGNTGAITQATVDFVIAGGTSVNLQSLNLPWTVIPTGAAGGGGSGGGGGGGALAPIVFDLTGDGLALSPVANSDIITKDANGVINRLGWVGPTNGILAVDRGGDGKINTTADISFIQDAPGAKNDLQGLAGWDTNHDGVINAEDANWNKLVIWVDKNQDGVAEAGEVETLAQAGVAAISLTGAPTGFTGNDTTDSFVDETTSFTRADGASGTAYDVFLARQFLTPEGFGNAPDVSWDQLTANAQIGQLLNDPLAAAAGLALTAPGAALSAASALVTIGHAIGRSKITEAQLSKLAVTDFTGSGKISAADAARWADFLDPKKNAALKAAIASGMTGTDLLNTIKATRAFPLGFDQLTGRGVSQKPERAAEPIIVDFAGTGLGLIAASASTVKLDTQHTGTPQQIGWVGGDAGILAYDLSGSGVVDPTSEISFAADKPGAKDSVQGLAAFDTNGDGVIDASDASFSKFLIWRDANQNGVSDPGETQTLAQAGITAISLKETKTAPSNGDVTSNQILGQITVTLADGATRTAYDTALGVNVPSPSATSAAAPAYAPSAGAYAAPAAGYTAPTASSPSPSPAASAAAAPASAVATTLGSLSGASGGVTTSNIGEDGPEGSPSQPVAPNTSNNGALGWWQNPGANVSILSGASVSTLAGASSGQGAPTTGVVAAVPDAATLQRQLLLLQSLAAFQASANTSAPVWSHQADPQTPVGLVAAAAQIPAPKAPAPVSLGG